MEVAKKRRFLRGLLWLPQAVWARVILLLCPWAGEAAFSFKGCLLCTASWLDVSKPPSKVLGIPPLPVLGGGIALGIITVTKLGSVGGTGLGGRGRGGKSYFGISPTNTSCWFGKHRHTPVQTPPGVPAALRGVQRLVTGCFLDLALSRERAGSDSPTAKSPVSP